VQTKPFLTRDDVIRILLAARQEAEKNTWAVTIAVVDAGG
jgi:glc operon protein GlcG